MESSSIHSDQEWHRWLQKPNVMSKLWCKFHKVYNYVNCAKRHDNNKQGWLFWHWGGWLDYLHKIQSESHISCPHLNVRFIMIWWFAVFQTNLYCIENTKWLVVNWMRLIKARRGKVLNALFPSPSAELICTNALAMPSERATAKTSEWSCWAADRDGMQLHSLKRDQRQSYFCTQFGLGLQTEANLATLVIRSPTSSTEGFFCPHALFLFCFCFELKSFFSFASFCLVSARIFSHPVF